MSDQQNGNRRIIVPGGEDKAVAELADEIVTSVDDILNDKKRCSLFLAGGSTPEKLYRLLSEEPYLSSLPWNRLDFFWGDERYVAHDHPDSNYLMAYQALLSRVPVQADQRYPVPGAGECTPAEAAESYEETLRNYFTPEDSPAEEGNYDRPDIVLLGLGEDCHTASLFPGTPPLTERSRWVFAHYIKKLGNWRITLTPVFLNEANNIFFLVTGRKKAYAVKSVLQGDSDGEKCPARLIEPANGSVTWYLDSAASSELED